MKSMILILMMFCSTSEAAIHRSQSVKAQFQRNHPCPSTGKNTGACPGYVKDHIKALACGGADSTANMQWQTIAEVKEKDKLERKGCK